MVALCCPLHDPDGRYLQVLEKYGRALSQFYSRISICATPMTSETTISRMKKLGWDVELRESLYGEGRRVALQHAERQEVYHCSDLDRMLHWVSEYPSELKDVLKWVQGDFLILGRTDRAFQTHPFSWQLTESAINTVASQLLRKNVDITAGACLLSEKAKTFLLRSSKERGFGVCGEWPLLLQDAGMKISYRSVEGYEWEDPDRFQDEIKSQGYEEWLSSRYQTEEEWMKRIDLLKEQVEGMFDLTRLLTERRLDAMIQSRQQTV
ncbi:MAG TPA: hypothetical protein VJB91_01535 [Patescibacteria group bacterium]|nr:hypothetical protein [Patescibacteria group bacterium]